MNYYFLGCVTQILQQQHLRSCITMLHNHLSMFLFIFCLALAFWVFLRWITILLCQYSLTFYYCCFIRVTYIKIRGIYPQYIHTDTKQKQKQKPCSINLASLSSFSNIFMSNPCFLLEGRGVPNMIDYTTYLYSITFPEDKNLITTVLILNCSLGQCLIFCLILILNYF